MQELCKSFLRNLKKPFLVFFLIILISFIVLAENLVESYNDPITYSMGDLRWCKLYGVCTLSMLTLDNLVVYNLSVIGQVFNVTMNLVTWNITDSFNVGGNLEAKNATFENLEVTGTVDINYSLQDAYDDGDTIIGKVNITNGIITPNITANDGTLEIDSNLDLGANSFYIENGQVIEYKGYVGIMATSSVGTGYLVLNNSFNSAYDVGLGAISGFELFANAGTDFGGAYDPSMKFYNNGNVDLRTGISGNFTFGNLGTPLVTIKDDGKVGIGTTTPSQKLEVIGNITADNFFGNGSKLTDLTHSLQDAYEDGSVIQANTKDVNWNLSGISLGQSGDFVITLSPKEDVVSFYILNSSGDTIFIIGEDGSSERFISSPVSSAGWTPLQDNTYDFGCLNCGTLGAPLRWRDGYFTNIFKGGTTLKFDASTGLINTTGNITTGKDIVVNGRIYLSANSYMEADANGNIDIW